MSGRTPCWPAVICAGSVRGAGRGVVDLGHNFGLTIVAEGVETAEALTALAGFGCDVAQGYHLARPMPVDTWYAARPLAEVLINGQRNPRLLAELAKGGARVQWAPWPRR
jgi:hypothetical protein